MGRLRVIIADPEEAYVQGLSDYISSFHSQRFEIYSITRQDYLYNHLSREDKAYDLILLSPDFYSADLPVEKSGAIALLESGPCAHGTGGFPLVNKYQHVEKLISDIAAILAENHKGQLVLPVGRRNARLIGVYSAAGGTGKSTISLSCSIQSAIKGLKVFYLNLETIQTSSYLEWDSHRSLSKILFYLKEKNPRLPLKIEGTRCIDTRYGIHYFSPADFPFDLEYVSPEEYTTLVEAFKFMGQYDLIFLDLTSNFSLVNTTLLTCCDRLVLISQQEEAAVKRHAAMVEQLTKISRKSPQNPLENSLLVINKYESSFTGGQMDWHGKADGSVTLPMVQGSSRDGIETYLKHNAFMEGIDTILEKLE